MQQKMAGVITQNIIQNGNHIISQIVHVFKPLSFYYLTGILLSLIIFDIMKLTVLICVLFTLSTGTNKNICFGQYSFGNCKTVA